MQRSKAGQERSLGDGEVFEGHGPAGPTQQRLHEAEVEDREGRILVRPGKLPDERVGKPDQQFPGGGKLAVHLQFGVGPQGIQLPAGMQTPVVVHRRFVVAEELDVEAESLGAHVEGREVDLLQLFLELRRVDPGDRHGRLQGQLDASLGRHLRVFACRWAPTGIFQLTALPVDEPLLVALLAVDAVHIHMGGRIVLGHRRTDLVARIVEPAPRIHLDVEVGGAVQPRVVRLLGDKAFGLLVGLMVVAFLAAAGLEGHDERAEPKHERGNSRLG